jgi:hypothetical protein
MILVDANVLLYAHDTRSPHHEPARAWLEAALCSGRAVRFALVSLLAFVRITSDRRVFERPLEPAEACTLVHSWLALPTVRVLEPGPRHWQVLAEMAAEGQATGPMVMDAHLAALAMEHGATVATTDRDFTRFEGLTIINPVRDPQAGLS